jgi:wyosine [tRNA(Phe)-imidazoG37] synthetase (radical SAM superfamily)
MSTFLFDKTIFGPVKSRRLGVSLGINLLPNTRKLCNFNCIYCECGWNPEVSVAETLPTVDYVERELEARLFAMSKNEQPLDVITFAGNGEPCMHPQFAEIIDITICLRNTYFPKVEIAVLSNSTLVRKTEVYNALTKVDKNIMKLDSAFEETCKLINKPVGYFNLAELITSLKLFHGNLIIQTMFVQGSINGIEFDNTSDIEIAAWIDVLKTLNPEMVMIYTIARDTPAENLQKIPLSKLNSIAELLKFNGFSVSVSE